MKSHGAKRRHRRRAQAIGGAVALVVSREGHAHRYWIPRGYSAWYPFGQISLLPVDPVAPTVMGDAPQPPAQRTYYVGRHGRWVPVPTPTLFHAVSGKWVPVLPVQSS